MARAKTKAAGTNLPVPQSDAEAEQLIARLGALQRDDADAKAAHDGQVAALEEKRGAAVKAFQEAQGVILDALSIWATANRERLTQGGKTKTVQLPTGTVLWREGRYAVKHRGLKIENVIDLIRDRIAALEEEAARARRDKNLREGGRLAAEAVSLRAFLRFKTELNKEAMLTARDVARSIPGVKVDRGPEEFAVEPLASQIREVA